MLTVIVLIALVSSAWGAFEKACDLRNEGLSVADIAIGLACLSCALTALHSLVVIWIRP